MRTGVSEADYIDVIREAQERGDVDGGDGGVHHRLVADALDISEAKAKQDLSDLAEERDDLKHVWGMGPYRPRKSFLVE